MPGRGERAIVAVTRTTVSPYCTVTAPLACGAKSPVSMLRVRPPHSSETLCGCIAILFLYVEMLATEDTENAQKNTERLKKAKIKDLKPLSPRFNFSSIFLCFSVRSPCLLWLKKSRVKREKSRKRERFSRLTFRVAA